MQDVTSADILKEDGLRCEKYAANYDPVTGEGLADLLGEERVRLSIEDFPIKEQWVPKEMMRIPLIKGIAKCGSVEKYLTTHKWKNGTPDALDIERQIRRIRHKHDFCFWAFFCITIDSKTGGRVRFKLNYPQLIVLARCEQLRKAGVPIDIIILKARQWGGSTFCIFYQTWIALKWDRYHNFVVAAHVQSAAETILTMLKSALSTYPAWDLRLPDGTTIELAKRGQTNNAYVLKDGTHKQIYPTVFYIGSAEKPESLRSSNVHGAHYSEVGVWPDTPEKRPESLVASISGGITKRALDMQAMESTAKSADDYFHEIWSLSLKGESSYSRIFIPWFYIPHDTIPFRNDAERDEFVKWLLTHKDDDVPNGKWRDSGRHYWRLWTLGATLAGINWYRYKRLDYTSYSGMANEAPSTWQEAFQSAGLKVFDAYDVEEMAKHCRKPAYEGELVSDGIEGAAVLDNIRFIQKQGGTLKIWEMPDNAKISDRYLVVVDIGGIRQTSDWSSVRVFDRLMMMPDFGLHGKPNIVAEMHYHTYHDLLAYDAMRLAAWYNNALLVIESNTVEMQNRERDVEGGGSEYILDIISDIYPNQYMRKNGEEDVDDKVQRKWGFRTDGITKPKIIHHMQACVRDKAWIEPSEICCEEMSQYTQHDGNKFDAPPKKHDDVVMSTAIGLWVCYKEMEIPKWIVTAERRRTTIKSNDNSVII